MGGMVIFYSGIGKSNLNRGIGGRAGYNLTPRVCRCYVCFWAGGSGICLLCFRVGSGRRTEAMGGVSRGERGG